MGKKRRVNKDKIIEISSEPIIEKDDIDTNFSASVSNSNQCTIRDISLFNITINAHKKDLFVDTDLKIIYGNHYGLVGKNGIGKTTLLKHIAYRKLPISDKMDVLYIEQEIESTDVSVFETVMSAHQERLILIKRSKYLEDHLDEDDALFDEYQEITDKLIVMGADKDESKVHKILSGLGFSIKEQEYATKQFSGGWRMRISIARALYMEPTLLLLDEPTNHLDLTAVIWFTEYLKKWKSTLLIVSHNQSFLNEICTHIINIESQKLVEYSGNYSKFRRSYHDKYRRQEKEWLKVKRKLKEMKNKSIAKIQQEEYLKNSEIMEPDRPYDVKIRFNDFLSLSMPILEIKDVTFGYREDDILFRNLDFGLDLDSRITLVGANGVGKSTLINLLVGNLVPLSGNIIRNSQLRIGYYNQHFAEFLPMDQTPVEYILLLGQKNKTHDNVQEVRKSLGCIGLESNAHGILIKQLSGGQKARVAFVALTAMKPHILFLDEPTNHLDVETIDALIDGINSYKGGVIIISHDVELITRTDCRLWVCKNNNVEEYEEGYEEYRNEILETIDAL